MILKLWLIIESSRVVGKKADWVRGKMGGGVQRRGLEGGLGSVAEEVIRL